MPNVATSWADPAWLADAHAWIEEQLAACGLAVTGPIEQPHLRWWSTVLRVPTDDGVLWMKAAQPMYAFETRVTPFLARHWPDLTVEVMATDPDRGWMLSRDAGTRLREATDRPVIDHWADLLPRYAELQLAAAEHRRQLGALGEPDRGLPRLARDLRATVDEPGNLLVGDPRGLTPGEVEALRDRLDAFDADCRRLAEIGIPATLQHDDLHDGNAFVRGGGYVVFDWGDSCISHPFHTLSVTLRALAYSQHLEPGGPEIQRMLDVYLEPWQRIAPARALREAADIARRTGTIGRAMAYRSWLGEMPPDVADQQRESIPYGLRLFLADGPWGSWDDGSF
ncbi:MAG TPA: phosphotransferase [Candidatus Limnocylindria bacterium]